MADETESPEQHGDTRDASGSTQSKRDAETTQKTASPSPDAETGQKTGSASQNDETGQKTGSASQNDETTQKTQKTASSSPDGAHTTKNPSADAAEAEKAFVLFGKTMEKTDWEWKNKSGEEREIGRQLFHSTKLAWVEAAVHDPKRADQMWRKQTNQAPKADMELMLKERLQKNVGVKQPSDEAAIDTLAGRLDNLDDRRSLIDATTRKTTLRASLSEWNILRGDSQSRSEDARKQRTTELLSPEANRADDGMHLLRSFAKGFMTHRERTKAKVEKHKSKLAGDGLKELHKDIGKATTKIKEFETKLNIPMKDRQSIGLVGKSRKAVKNLPGMKLGIGTATVLARVSMKVADKGGDIGKRVAEKGGQAARSVAIQGAAIMATPGSIDGNQGAAAYQTRMAAFRQFQQSRPGPGTGA